LESFLKSDELRPHLGINPQGLDSRRSSLKVRMVNAMIENTESAKSAIARKCAIYVRCASIEQSAERMEAQERRCRKAAANRGWEVSPGCVYRDEGVSGLRPAGRIGLEALLAEALRVPCLFDCVLVDDASRLYRNLNELALFIMPLKMRGVDVFVAGNRGSDLMRIGVTLQAVFDHEVSQ